MNPDRRAMEKVAEIEAAVHDLCQPLTVLQCRLELGLLQGSQEATYAAAVQGIQECRRMNAALETIRMLLGGFVA